MADNEVNGSSSDEGMMSDHDVEESITSGDQRMREYYLGKKYFEFALATRLLEQSSIDEAWSELDVSRHRL